MPLKNSRFRIIHRRSCDPHGAEGYFIHEIYVKPDLTVTGWRAGVSLGALDLDTLKNHMIRTIEAFNHEPIDYCDLSTSGFKLPSDDQVQVSETKKTIARYLDQKQASGLPSPGTVSDPDY